MFVSLKKGEDDPGTITLETAIQRIEEKMRVDLVVQGIYLALQGFVFQFLVVSLHFLFTCGEDINPAERVYSNE